MIVTRSVPASEALSRYRSRSSSASSTLEPRSRVTRRRCARSSPRPGRPVPPPPQSDQAAGCRQPAARPASCPGYVIAPAATDGRERLLARDLASSPTAGSGRRRRWWRRPPASNRPPPPRSARRSGPPALAPAPGDRPAAVRGWALRWASVPVRHGGQACAAPPRADRLVERHRRISRSAIAASRSPRNSAAPARPRRGRPDQVITFGRTAAPRAPAGAPRPSALGRSGPFERVARLALSGPDRGERRLRICWLQSAGRASATVVRQAQPLGDREVQRHQQADRQAVGGLSVSVDSTGRLRLQVIRRMP